MWLLTTRSTILHGATLRSTPLLLTLLHPVPLTCPHFSASRWSRLSRRGFQQRGRHHSFWQGCAIMTCWLTVVHAAKATRPLPFNETNIVVAFSRRLKGTDTVSFFISPSYNPNRLYCNLLVISMQSVESVFKLSVVNEPTNKLLKPEILLTCNTITTNQL